MNGSSSSEQERLDALRSYDVLDTDPDNSLDTLTRVTARLLDVPISLVSLIDEHRQWFKSRVGLDVTETPRDVAFCDHAIRQHHALIVEDALADPRFADNPLVLGEPGIRFYLGIPLFTPDGHGLGTLCVVDRSPRTASPEQVELLRRLAQQVLMALETHRRLGMLEQSLTEHRDLQHSRELLASMVVHDLRSPLTAIFASASILALEPLPRSAGEAVKLVLGEAERMQRLLLDVLDLCVSETAGLPVRLATVDLRSLAAVAATRFAASAPVHGRELRWRPPAVPVSARVDPELIERVLGNLLDNASRAAPPGTEVELTLVPEADHIVLAVADNGPGLPEDQRALVFDAFSQSARAAIRRGSRGLGLAFCRIAAEAHGGTIAVEPNHPSGARFVVRLPRGERSAPGLDPSSS